MKKVLFIMTLVFVMYGCKDNNPEKSTDDPVRFEWVYYQNLGFYFLECGVLRDNETNTEYLVVETTNGIGVTKLEPKGNDN